MYNIYTVPFSFSSLLMHQLSFSDDVMFLPLFREGVVVALQSFIFHFGILSLSFSLSLASFYLTICYVYSYFPSNCLVKTLVGAELGVPHMRLIFSWRRRLFASVDLFHLSLAASVVVVSFSCLHGWLNTFFDSSLSFSCVFVTLINDGIQFINSFNNNN